jgi:hypothetical protein
VPAAVRRGRRHLEKIILQRKACLEQYGNDWQDKPVRIPIIFPRIL